MISPFATATRHTYLFVKLPNDRTIRKMRFWGAWLAQAEECATFGLEVVSLSTTLGVWIT